jgi:predicted amidophosphoribosyltransferase
MTAAPHDPRCGQCGKPSARLTPGGSCRRCFARMLRTMQRLDRESEARLRFAQNYGARAP